MFEVAWHELPLAAETDVSNLSDTPSMDHKHLLTVLAKWEEATDDGRQLVVITEIVDAGTLESHTARIKSDVRTKVVKKWCRQILDGLRHLHEETGRVSQSRLGRSMLVPRAAYTSPC
jgi:serine/threonine protein kinase